MCITGIFIKIILKINYRILRIAIMVLIVMMSFYFCGFIGFLILLIATLIGLIPIGLGIGKNHAMGCILLPVIFLFCFMTGRFLNIKEWFFELWILLLISFGRILFFLSIRL